MMRWNTGLSSNIALVMWTTSLLACLLVASSLTCQAQDNARKREASRSPAQKDLAYVLGENDEIAVWVDQIEQLSGRQFTIDRDGCITLPLAGRVHVEGLTVEQAQVQLREALKRYVLDPEVGISLLQTKNEGVSITGSVARPGVYQLSEHGTLVDMLMAAGGVQQNAGPSAVIMRQLSSGRLDLSGAHDDPSGRFSMAEVNVRSVMALKDSAHNIRLVPGDTVSIPEARMVYVIGDVNKPGAFAVSDEQQATALQLLAMAGGPLKSAAPQKSTVLRHSETSDKPELINVNLKQLLKGKNSDLQLKANDILFVPNSAEKAATARALDAAIQAGLFAVTYGVIYR